MAERQLIASVRIDKLTELMKIKGWNRADLVDELEKQGIKLEYQTLHAYIHNKLVWKLIDAKVICRLLDTTTEELFEEVLIE